MKHVYFALLVLTTLFGASVWQNDQVTAATRLTDDLADLFKAAELVVDAEVLDRRAAPAGTEGLPLTAVTLKVNRVLKGTGVASGEKLDAEYLGGNAGAVQTIVPGQPDLAPGAHVVVLLSRFGRLTHWRVIGGDSGEIDFRFADDGLPVAHRTCGASFSYYIRDPQSLTGFTAISATTLNEEQFQQLFEAIATTGRPVIESPDTSSAASSFTVAASASTLTSAPARHVNGGSSAAPATAVSAGPSAAPAVPSLAYRLLVTLALVTLGWILGRRLIVSINELSAKGR